MNYGCYALFNRMVRFSYASYNITRFSPDLKIMKYFEFEENYSVGKVGAGIDSVKTNPSADTVHYCVVRSKDYRVIVI